MYVKTFKRDVTVFIGTVIMYLTSHFSDDFQCQGQFVYIENISLREIKGKMLKSSIHTHYIHSVYIQDFV
jgi:hypothetical protein